MSICAPYPSPTFLGQKAKCAGRRLLFREKFRLNIPVSNIFVDVHTASQCHGGVINILTQQQGFATILKYKLRFFFWKDQLSRLLYLIRGSYNHKWWIQPDQWVPVNSEYSLLNIDSNPLRKGTAKFIMLLNLSIKESRQKFICYFNDTITVLRQAPSFSRNSSALPFVELG